MRPSIRVGKAMKRPLVWLSLIVVVCGGMIVRRQAARDSRARPLDAFVTVAAELPERPYDVRLSGGFAYKPKARVLRASSDAAIGWRLLAASAPLSADGHARAVSQLALQRIDSSIDMLERLLKQETGVRTILAAVAKSKNATLLSDLAAAYFVRGRRTDRARDVIMAAECAARAYRLDARHPEAAWNRAVIFESMALADVARVAWLDFIAIDSGSAWSVEARGRLRTLETPPLSQRWKQDRQRLLDAAAREDAEMVSALVEIYPEQARILVEEDLLGEWAASGRDLRSAAAIANAIAIVSHDAMPRDAVAVAVAGQRLEPLARGHRGYVAARRLFRAGQHPDAQPIFAAAAADLDQAGSPLAFRALSYDAVCRHYLGQQKEALNGAVAALRRLGAKVADYPVVAGQLGWTCGLSAMSLGYPDDALLYYRESLRSFERTEETSNLAGITQVLSSGYRAVGDLERAWSYQLRSFALISRYAPIDRVQVVIGPAAVTAFRDGYVVVAEELQHRQLIRARGGSDPVLLADALIRRSEMLARNGARHDARMLLVEAMAAWNAAPETAVKSRLRADLEVVRALASSDLPARERIAELDTAMEYVAKSTSRSRIPKVLLLRARAHLEAGDNASADRDLAAGIAEAEAQRGNTTTTESRITFLDTVAELYDEAIRLHLDRGDEAGAFDLLEQRRARWLLDRVAARGEPWPELRRRIPRGIAIVSYSVSDRVRAWVATADGLRHVELAGAADAIADDVFTWRDAIESGSADEKRRATSLHAALVEPLHLAGFRGIVVVPDRFLNWVPFGALRDAKSHRRLIEDQSIAIAGNANLYIRYLERPGSVAPAARTLIVANPASGAGEESLEALEGAEIEAAAIAAMIPPVSVLRGADATIDRFLGSARDAARIHFSGHAVVNQSRPELSALVLAPDAEGRRTRLYARDIYSMQLPHTRLVVLAACSSAGGAADAESPLTLAQAFTAAGVPTTIASLWAVDDAESAAFFRAFYRKLRGGTPPQTALREVQIESLRNGAIKQRTWAAYQLYGGPSL